MTLTKVVGVTLAALLAGLTAATVSGGTVVVVGSVVVVVGGSVVLVLALAVVLGVAAVGPERLPRDALVLPVVAPALASCAVTALRGPHALRPATSAIVMAGRPAGGRRVIRPAGNRLAIANTYTMGS